MVTWLENFFAHTRVCCERVYTNTGRPSLIAKLSGKNHHNPLSFIAHVDVVPVGTEERLRWNSPPFIATRREDKIYGRGAADMKAGLLAVATAMRNVAQNLVPPQDINLFATCDEENMMQGSKSLLDKIEPKGDCALIVAEPTAMKAMRASRGRTFAQFTLHGKTAHASEPAGGMNAISLAHHFWSECSKERHENTDDGQTGSTFWQALAIEGRLDPGIVPERCTLTIDARLSLIDSCDALWGRAQNALQRTLINAALSPNAIDLQILDRREPWETPENHPLVQKLCELGAAFGPVFMGSTDANILYPHGFMPVIIGPGSLHCAHRENEFIAVDELYKAYELYCSIIKSWH